MIWMLMICRQSESAGFGGEDVVDPTIFSRLPLGIAGILSMCFGIAGAVVGMSEVWYTGPLGKMAGAAYGADLGFEVWLILWLIKHALTGFAYSSQLLSRLLLTLCCVHLRSSSLDDKGDLY
jgi:hypothetical protein